MNALQIIRALAAGVPAKKWTVSDNGVRKGPVTEVNCGLHGTMVWLRFQYQADGADHKIEGSMPVTGGQETIKLDGQDVEHDDIVLSNRIVGFPPKIVIVVEYKFLRDGADHRIRFDGPMG